MSKTIDVVSGVPRSGTSLVMQMLAAGGHPVLVDAARPADAHNPRGYFEYERAKATASDATWLPLAVGRAIKVIHALVMHLPDGFEYRVILVRRDLQQVVASQDAMLAAGDGAPGALDPARLVEIYSAQLSELDAWLASRAHFRVLRLDYAELLTAPADVANEICEFLGASLDVAAMAACVDSALHRQR